MPIELLNVMLADYASLRSRIEEAERVRDELTEKILAEFEAGGLAKYEVEQGTFSIQKRTAVAWNPAAGAAIKTLSDESKRKMDEVKKDFLSRGMGTEEEARSLRFQKVKG